MPEATANDEEFVQAVIRDPELIAEIDQILEDHDLQKSQLIRFALAEFVDREYPGSSNAAWECRECGLTFADSDGFDAHRKYTECERDYTCDDCGKSFPTPGALGGHREMH